MGRLVSRIRRYLLAPSDQLLRLSRHVLTPTMAQDFATAVIGIICLVVTMDIAAAYRSEPTA